MNSFQTWFKTNKTTIAGVLTILWGALSAYLVSKQIIDITLAGTITTVLIGAGLYVAKDATDHSTLAQVVASTNESTTNVPVQASIVTTATTPIVNTTITPIVQPVQEPLPTVEITTTPVSSKADIVLGQIATLLEGLKTP